MTLPEYIVSVGPGQWRLKIWAQPGAKRSEPAGEYQGRLKVKIAAPAVDNKANKALLKFVAGLLRIKPSMLRLENGETSRKKTIGITTDKEPAWERLFGPGAKQSSQG